MSPSQQIWIFPRTSYDRPHSLLLSVHRQVTITQSGLDFFWFVLRVEEEVKDLSHLVLPVYSHHQRLRLSAHYSRLELYDT